MDSIVTMLAVGQGAMNLIEIYDVLEGERVLVNLSLIDCGSIDGHPVSKAACEKSLGFAVEKMRERYDTFGDGMMLDHLLLTHKDADHWNLLERLFQMAIGVETALVSENIGYLRVEESDNYIENYYVNRLEGNYRYEKNYYDECEIELTFTYKVSGQDSIPEMILEYEYGDNYMSVCWRPEFLSVSVFNVYRQLNQPVGLCIFGRYGLFLPKTKEHINWEIPSGYKEFLELFFDISGILQVILENYTDIPAGHTVVMREMLTNINVSREDIEKVTMENPDHVPPFIKNLYIGGNSSAFSGKFGAMERTLTMLSKNREFLVNKGRCIDLYGRIQLYIIEKLNEYGLKRVNNAESVSKPSIKNNATSIVSVLLLDGESAFKKIVFTGDATVHTFYQMLLDIDADIKQGKPVKYKNAAWTAPHHGAYKTIHGKIPIKGGEVFPALLEQVHPTEMVVSAGVVNIHGHPCRSFMDLVENYFTRAGIRDIPHDIYRNTNDKNRAGGAVWEFAPIECPLYTTYTILQDGSEGYRDYVFSFSTENAVPAENRLLLENREEPAGRVFGSTTIPSKTEIPSKSMFFHR